MKRFGVNNYLNNILKVTQYTCRADPEKKKSIAIDSRDNPLLTN